ncbi:uncharacterized protein [Phyllobates terribilis]|uniref:uncharacterized protein n=1 Tax=Phyllobates terribilis TaxID=111132 RepID=UPI003CCB36FF
METFQARTEQRENIWYLRPSDECSAVIVSFQISHTESEQTKLVNERLVQHKIKRPILAARIIIRSSILISLGEKQMYTSTTVQSKTPQKFISTKYQSQIVPLHLLTPITTSTSTTKTTRAFSFSPSSSLQQSMEFPPEGYRRNVGICLINSSKQIFVASRLDIPDAWQMPQGGIDEDEDSVSAAIRELREETGVSSAQVIAEVPYWLCYDFPPDVREKLRHQWGSDWKGQAQKWFLLKLTGDESEINLNGDGSEKPEFGQWSWMPPERVIELAVGFKRPVYKEVLTVFAPHLQ